MSEVKSTPGPWFTDKSMDVGILCVIKTKDKLIVHVCTKISSDEARANSKLIAAAPELLENLTRIIDRILENDLQNHFPSAFDRAMAVIKKATT